MYFDLDNGTETDEDFFTALTLLHSTNDDSAEKLRQMLDASITKKCGPSKTLAARMRPDSFSLLSEARKIQANKLPNQNETIKNKYPSIKELPRYRESHTSVTTHGFSSTAIVTTKIGQKMTNVLVAVDRTEIPTISIPDEGSSAGDGALCKICNGARLGPLILLECQECQDVYHPLCHQPPVLDLDIYDPRLVWHCAKCVELSDAEAVIAAATGGLTTSKTLWIMKNERETNDDTINNDSKEHLNFFQRNKTRHNYHQKSLTSDQFQLRNTTSIGRRSAKRQTNTRSFNYGMKNQELKNGDKHFPETVEQVFGDRNGSLKNGQALAFSSTSSSGLHLRKRVGSKLTITRTTAK